MTNEKEYAPEREPTEQEWTIWAAFLDSKRSVSQTAFALGVDRRVVCAAVNQIRYWRQDCGWSARFQQAIREGFSLADAELHANQHAAYMIRVNNPEQQQSK